MTASDADRQATELSVAWDALLTGHSARTPPLEPRVDRTLRLVHAARKVDVLDDSRVDEIWGKVIAGTTPRWMPDPSTVDRPAVVLPHERRIGASAARGLPRVIPVAAMRDAVERFAWVVVAGFLGGFVAGIGARLAMRIAGFLTVDGNRFTRTENGNMVGEITLDGTVSLGLLGGAVGIGVLLIYLGVRDRLPGSGWRRSLGFSLLLLVVFGYVVMDPGNPDYQRFGPTWLNVGTFSSLYLVMGFCTSQAYEGCRRTRDRLRGSRAHRLARIPALVLSPVIASLGLFVMVAITFIALTGIPLVALGVLVWLASRVAARRTVPMPRSPGPLRRWGMLALPMTIGLLLTVRGITEILTGG